jgi:4-diphosphocytidyl-2-C-methyl-D-erythritol kinase
MLATDFATASAKINLYLHVVGKRADGYHLLESLIVFARYGDVITVAPSAKFSLEIEGPFAGKLAADEDNLVLRAARGLATLLSVKKGAAITLTKNLPVASGIGGGSADAAATMKALQWLWNRREFDWDALAGFALSLGADVPVCYFNRTSYVSGIGENVRGGGELPAADLLLVNPGVATPTPAVFKARSGDFSKSDPWEVPLEMAFGEMTAAQLVELLQSRRNDLTVPAIKVAPVIADVLEAIEETRGCLLSRLSGSGATCFGIYADAQTAEAAKVAILTQHPDWWAVATKIKNEPY